MNHRSVLVAVNPSNNVSPKFHILSKSVSFLKMLEFSFSFIAAKLDVHHFFHSKS